MKPYKMVHINLYAIVITIVKNMRLNFINTDIQIDFKLSRTMEDLIVQIEMANANQDCCLYLNLADAIDSQAKKEVEYHIISETEWKQLNKRYPF